MKYSSFCTEINWILPCFAVIQWHQVLKHKTSKKLHTQLSTSQISIEPSSFQVKEEFYSNHAITYWAEAETEKVVMVRQNNGQCYLLLVPSKLVTLIKGFNIKIMWSELICPSEDINIHYRIHQKSVQDKDMKSPGEMVSICSILTSDL